MEHLDINDIVNYMGLDVRYKGYMMKSMFSKLILEYLEDIVIPESEIGKPTRAHPTRAMDDIKIYLKSKGIELLVDSELTTIDNITTLQEWMNSFPSRKVIDMKLTFNDTFENILPFMIEELHEIPKSEVGTPTTAIPNRPRKDILAYMPVLGIHIEEV